MGDGESAMSERCVVGGVGLLLVLCCGATASNNCDSKKALVLLWQRTQVLEKE